MRFWGSQPLFTSTTRKFPSSVTSAPLKIQNLVPWFSDMYETSQRSHHVIGIFREFNAEHIFTLRFSQVMIVQPMVLVFVGSFSYSSCTFVSVFLEKNWQLMLWRIYLYTSIHCKICPCCHGSMPETCT